MAQSLGQILIHIVFSTKHRLPLLTKPLREDLHAYIGGIVAKRGGVLLNAGSVDDHIHLLVAMPRTMSSADMIRDIKSGSSQWLRSSGLSPSFEWQRGYGAFSVSACDLPRVASYIQNQERHHGKCTFQTEFEELLHANGVEYDRRYLWVE